MFRISLRNQIVLWAGVCLLGSNIAGILFFTYTLNRQADDARRAAITAGEEKAQDTARTVARVYENEMNAALFASKVTEEAVSTGMSDASANGSAASPLLSRDQVTALLKNVLAGNPAFLDIYADFGPNAFDGLDSQFIGADSSDQDGRFVPWWAWSDGELQLQPGMFTYQDEVAEDYYRLPMDSKQDTLMEPYTDTVNNQSILMTSLIVPIMANDQFLGICGVDITLSDLQSQVDSVTASLYDGAAESQIISAGGLVVAHNNKPEWAGKALSDVDPANAEIVLAGLKSGEVVGRDSSGNILAYATIKPGETTTPWVVVLSVPEKKLTEQADAAFAQTKQLLLAMVGIAAAVCILALLVLWLFARAFTRPIQAAAGFLSMVAGGNVSQNVPQKLLDRKDELGGLSQSVHFVIESLRSIFTELVHSAETLGTSSARLLSVSEQTAAGATQSSTQANSVAAAAEELSVNTASVAAGVEQVTSRLDSIATSTDQLAASVGEIASSSENARVTTLEAAGHADQVSVMMKEMARAAQEIGKVTETITHISSQTNLLALNATIEAARAGAAGKGFAVVASEIKDLARQTTEATAEVKAQIASMQASTTSTAGEIEITVAVIRRISDAVNSIAASIEEHSVVTRDIAENIAQASSGLREANGRVGETAKVSRNISEEINGVSVTAQAMSQESRDLQISATELSQLAEQIHALIAQYKL